MLEIVLRELEETIDWEGLGLEVVGTAKDGIEGENMIKALSPDIVVTDIKLPGKNGLQMIEDAAVTNGIILSGYTDFEFTKRAIRLGVFDYLEKPVDDDELEASLKTLAIRIIEDEKDMDSISDGCRIVLKEDVQSHWIKVAIEYIGKNYMNQIALADISRLQSKHLRPGTSGCFEHFICLQRLGIVPPHFAKEGCIAHDLYHIQIIGGCTAVGA